MKAYVLTVTYKRHDGELSAWARVFYDIGAAKLAANRKWNNLYVQRATYSLESFRAIIQEHGSVEGERCEASPDSECCDIIWKERRRL